MLRLNLQTFGGRGGSSGASTKSSRSGGGTSRSAVPTVKKRTAKEIASMTRRQAVSAARSVFIRNNMRNGLSKAEAARRFELLVDGNTTPQLKRYIKRYQ